MILRFIQQHKRKVNWVFRALVLILFLTILYVELYAKDNLAQVWATFLSRLSEAHWGWLAISIGLMPLNWLSETQKWHQFVKRYEKISRWKALRAVLAGVSLSLFTPNRVGEFGGRILFVRHENQFKAVIANIVGNFSQIMVLVGCGLVGSAWYMHQHQIVPDQYLVVYTVLSLIGLGFMLLAYYQIRVLVPLIRRLPYYQHFKRYVKDLTVITAFSSAELTDILRWSLIRYLIYSTQYYCLVQYFGIKVGVIDGFSAIATLFLLQTSLPLPPITGLMARGTLAIQIWSPYGAVEINSLASTFGLWIINLIIPALIGTFSLFYVNISKALGYEND